MNRLCLCALTIAIVSAWTVAAVETGPTVPKPNPPAPDATPPKPAPGESFTSPDKDGVKEAPPQAPPQAPDATDLRSLIGVNPVGLKRAEVPRLPAMSLRGFVRPHGKDPMALLEIAELNRIFLVQVGTEIPITVQGRLSPVGRSELTGLAGPSKNPESQGRAAEGQSQVILKVLKVSGEGVTVEAGLLAQIIIIR